MSVLEQLKERSGRQCELCTVTDNLKVYEVPPVSSGGLDRSLLACETCVGQIENPDTTDANHWRCLNDSMWSEHEVVKVVAWRMLTRLKSAGWSQDLLDMMYLEEDALKWAQATEESEDEGEEVIHRDVNGVILKTGDTYTSTFDSETEKQKLCNFLHNEPTPCYLPMLSVTLEIK